MLICQLLSLLQDPYGGAGQDPAGGAEHHGAPEHGHAAQGRLGKNPFFFKKTRFSGFFYFIFFLFFWVFLGFFFGFFGFFYIFAQKGEFLGFFSFKNTFRCIQTLNYNHSYVLLIKTLSPNICISS
jgi:hypothetical protein